MVLSAGPIAPPKNTNDQVICRILYFAFSVFRSKRFDSIADSTHSRPDPNGFATGQTRCHFVNSTLVDLIVSSKVGVVGNLGE